MVLTQAKVGERGVQSLADDLSTAQLHLVDTAWRAAVPNSIPQTVYQKDSQSGNCFERLFAPLQGDVARRHHDRSKRSSIAVNVQRSERYQSFSRPTFCDHRGTAFALPLFSETHRGDSLGREWLSEQSGKPRRYRIVCIVQCRKALQDSLAQFASEHAEVIVDRVWNWHSVILFEKVQTEGNSTMADLSTQPCAASNEAGNSWVAEADPCRFTACLTWPLLKVMPITQRGRHFSMLTETELASWYQRLNFSKATRAVIDQVRQIGSGAPRRGWACQCEWLFPQPKNGCDHPV